MSQPSTSRYQLLESCACQLAENSTLRSMLERFVSGHSFPLKSKKRAAKVKSLDKPQEVEVSQNRSRPSIDEIMTRISEHTRHANEIREREREKAQLMLNQEIMAAKQEAELAKQSEHRKKQEKENLIRCRLEAIQARREQREFEHEVSKQRSRAIAQQHSFESHTVRTHRSFEEQEEEHRKQVLAKIHERAHKPVTEGLEEVTRLLSQVREKARRREIEMREHREAVEKGYSPVYQGRVYDEAMLELAKARHNADDDKHQRMYKQAKMMEYGRVVAQVRAMKAEKSVERKRDVSHTPTVKNPVSDAERKKIGDEYLRTSGARKFPEGMRLAPLTAPDPVRLAQDADFAKVKERDRKGLQYLRELREADLVRGQPARETFNKSQVVDEIKQMRVRTNVLERKLLYGSHDDHVLKDLPPERHSKVTFDDQQVAQTSWKAEASFVDVVNAKLEILKKIEDLRKRAPRDDSKW